MEKEVSEKIAVFYFSPIYYDYLYQRPQQLFREWRADYAESYEFYYADYPAAIRIVARSLRCFKQDLSALLLRKHAHNSEDPFVLTWPCVPRSFYGHALPQQLSQNSLSLRLIQSAIHRTLKEKCRKEQTKIAIVGSPFWEPVISKRDFNLVCYDYMDPVALWESSDYYPAQEQHEKLLMNSDIVFVTAQNLLEDARSFVADEDIVLVSNATDPGFFEENKNMYDVADVKDANRKKVGYMGTYHRVDIDLVYSIARKLTDVDFLLIGPLDIQRRRGASHRPDNVFILGTKEYTQLPAYVNAFDVALIPFKPSPIADSSDPVKLYDYFTLGKPVVATRLHELEKFADGRLLKIAETEDEFIDAINAFLSYDTEEWRGARRHIAEQNSWHDKARIMMAAIESKIEEC